MLDGIPIHPLADLFPLIDGEEFEALVADVKVNGVREPLAIWRGMLVDGRNRARAAHAAGITPPVKILPDNTDVAGYILSANVHRRQLSPGQRAAPDRSWHDLG